ncbi:MAG: DUF2461 domain-containing protein [Actinomycetota bacterium]
MAFTGFPQSGLSFLTTLGTKNREWFQANKAQYDAEVAQPAKDFVEEMTACLHDEISPLIIGQPKTNGSISPINNDLRFNPDASPYKDHVMMKWWEGDDKKTAPTLWIRLSQDWVGFASGMPLGDLDRWRSAVGGDAGADLQSAIDRLAKTHDLDVAGQALKKVPKPWPDDHPRADLLRHKMFQVRAPIATPKSVTSARFADWCTQRLLEYADVHRWLVEHMT